MIRLIVMLFFMLAVLPAQGHAFSFQQNSPRKQVSTLSRFSELRNKIDQKVLNMALAGYYSLKEQGKVSRDGILTVILAKTEAVKPRSIQVN